MTERSPSGRATHEPGLASRPGHSVSVPNAPENIWLLDYGSPECCWCDCPDPDYEDHDAVEYVRRDTSDAAIEIWRMFAQETSRLRGVLDAILVTCESDRSTIGKLSAIYRVAAQGIEAQRAETGAGSVEDESPVASAMRPKGAQ